MPAWKKLVVPVVLLLVSLLLDGGISFLFNSQLNTSSGVAVPRILVMSLIVLAFYLEPKQVVVLSAVFGFIYDSYYSGIIGIYIAGLVLIAYLVIQIRQVINPYLYVIIMINLIMLTVLEFFVFGVYKAIGLSTQTVQFFLVNRLGITLLFNTVLFLIVGYPLKKTVESLKKEEQTKSNKPSRSISIR